MQELQRLVAENQAAFGFIGLLLAILGAMAGYGRRHDAAMKANSARPIANSSPDQDLRRGG